MKFDRQSEQDMPFERGIVVCTTGSGKEWFEARNPIGYAQGASAIGAAMGFSSFHPVPKDTFRGYMCRVEFFKFQRQLKEAIRRSDIAPEAIDPTSVVGVLSTSYSLGRDEPRALWPHWRDFESAEYAGEPDIVAAVEKMFRNPHIFEYSRDRTSEEEFQFKWGHELEAKCVQRLHDVTGFVLHEGGLLAMRHPDDVDRKLHYLCFRVSPDATIEGTVFDLMERFPGYFGVKQRKKNGKDAVLESGGECEVAYADPKQLQKPSDGTLRQCGKKRGWVEIDWNTPGKHPFRYGVEIKCPLFCVKRISSATSSMVLQLHRWEGRSTSKGTFYIPLEYRLQMIYQAAVMKTDRVWFYMAKWTPRDGADVQEIIARPDFSVDSVEPEPAEEQIAVVYFTRSCWEWAFRYMDAMRQCMFDDTMPGWDKKMVETYDPMPPMVIDYVSERHAEGRDLDEDALWTQHERGMAEWMEAKKEFEGMPLPSTLREGKGERMFAHPIV